MLPVLKHYIETQAWQIEGIEEAMAAMDRGEGSGPPGAAHLRNHHRRRERTRLRRIMVVTGK
jgi:predicted transcriptional regulator